MDQETRVITLIEALENVSESVGNVRSETNGAADATTAKLSGVKLAQDRLREMTIDAATMEDYDE